MRSVIRHPGFLLVLLVVGIVPLAAQEEAAKPQTAEAAAADVLSAFDSGDQVALGTLAVRDRPDPWDVVEELRHTGAHDAAMAFAELASTAAPLQKDVEALPAYVSDTAPGTDPPLRSQVRIPHLAQIPHFAAN